MGAPSREILRQLLEDSSVKGSHLTVRVEHALDTSYWRNLVPGFHVEGTGAALEFAVADDAAIDAVIPPAREDGYFHLRNVLAPHDVRRLNTAIDRVTGAGWPAAFVFVYDECWWCARAPALLQAMTGVLGPGCALIPRVWPHVVPALQGAMGWSPHVDGDGPGRMSAWIALSDASLDNGCMYLVPRTATPPGVTERFSTRETLHPKEVEALLHGARALPAAPGDALGWGFDIIHWGGRVHAAGIERRSLSFEYIAASASPRDHERPLFPLDATPTFAQRLRTIAAGVRSYRRFEPLLARFDELARAIQARVD